MLTYLWIVHVHNSPSEFSRRHTHFSIFLLTALMALKIIKDEPESCLVLMYVILISNGVTLLLTINALMFDHNVSRYLSKSNDFSRELSVKGLGGYGIVYANLILLPFIIGGLKAIVGRVYQNKFLFLLLSLNFCLSVVYFIKAQYSIALALCCLILFCSLIRFKSVLSTSLTTLMLLVAAFACFTVISAPEILVDILEGTRYQQKVIGLMGLLSGSETTAAVSSRVEVYTRSVLTFVDNAAFGVGAYDERIGKHSDILDKFAQFGLIYGLSVMYALVYVPIKMREWLGYRMKKEILLVVVIILLIATLNTVPLEMGVSLIFGGCLLVYLARSELSGKIVRQ